MTIMNVTNLTPASEPVETRAAPPARPARLGTAARLARLALLALTAALAAVSCDQDAIFAHISSEPKPKDPRIPGAPTAIVRTGDDDNAVVWVAGTGSKTLHRYAGGSWSTVGTDAHIYGLAVAGGALYGLTGDDPASNLALRKWEDDAEDGPAWGKPAARADNMTGYVLQTVYGTGDGTSGKVFVGGRNGTTYAVFALGDSGLTKVDGPAALLSGAAVLGDWYYLATEGDGVWTTTATDSTVTATLVDGTSGTRVTGVMNVNGVVTAVTQGGSVLTCAESATTFTTLVSGPAFTGAMAIWEDTDSTDSMEKLLLLGAYSTSTYDKGYREIPLDDGGHPTASLAKPGSTTPTTVTSGSQSKYNASLAKYAVYHLLQVPASPVILAATTQNGLWGLHNDEWNYEE